MSIDDMDGPEWNYTAMSPKKRELAETLLHRLRARFAPRRLAALRPGQVVSGRAAAALGARRVSGARTASRCGSDDQLIADTTRAGHAHASPTARASSSSSPRAWACRRDSSITAYEDVPTAAARTRRRCRSMSIRCRPTSRRSDERARLRAPAGARTRRAGGLRAAVEGRRGDQRERSPRWHGRARGRCAASTCSRSRAIRRSGCACRWRRCRDCCREDEEPELAASIRSRRAMRCRRRATHRQRSARRQASAATSAARGDQDGALTVQVRDGHLHVFMPPIERARGLRRAAGGDRGRRARRQTRRCAIEGYTPPRDPRAQVLDVTPDPGVIEVNVHPAATWGELDGDHARRSTRKRG